MPVVTIPNVGRVTFPDSMSQDDITTSIERDILKREQSDQIVRRPETGGAAGDVGPVMSAGPMLMRPGPAMPQMAQTGEARQAEVQAIPALSAEQAEQVATTPYFKLPPLNDPQMPATSAIVNTGEGLIEQALLTPASPALLTAFKIPGVRQVFTALLGAAATKAGAEKLGEASVTGNRQQAMEGALLGGLGAAGFSDLLPRSAEAVKQIERTPDASSKPKTTTEDGNLRTQPERVVGQMPVEEGGSGVQPQTEGRLPETPPGTLTPAIQVQGKTFAGEDHLAAYKNAKTSGQPDTSGAQEGFINDKGGFLTREEAAKQTGLPTETEPGKLHSSDLESKPPPSSSETVPQTEAPAAATVSEAKASGVTAPEAPPATSKPTPLEPLTQASSAGTEGETQAQRGTETPAAQVERPGGDLLSGGLTGMGGAVPSEFKPSAEGATAMKYRLIDQERVQRGLEPLTKPEGRADQEVLDRAKAAIDADPGLPERLVSELRNKPRPIEDWENHVLLLRKIDLRNEYAKATRDIAQAFDDGREEDLVAAKVRRAEWSDKLTELEQASRKAGSERGRALRALRVMANEDFSLASMESELRGIKGGERLTPDETSKIEQISREYEAKVSALEQHNAELGQKLAQAEADKALAELKAQAAKPAGVSDYVLKTAESWVKKWEGEAAQARTRLAGKFLSPTPDDLLDLAKIVRFRIGELGLDVARITAELVADFGEGVKPYITGAIETAQKMIDELAAKTPRGADVRERVKETGIKGAVPTVETVSAKIKAKAAKGELSEISPLVQKLARMFVEQGINTRDALIESVHNVLKDIVPNITPRETMDAISGYGQFKALTKDQISVQLRDLKGQMQQIGKLEDMAEKKAPLKTGVERRTPSDEERRLIKLVNEAKKKGGFQITDPATQLRSALQAVQTRLRNQIVDLQQEIDTRQRVVKERRTLQYDDATKALVAQRDALKAQHDEIFGKRQVTDQQRVAMAMRALEKSIADYNERIAKGDIVPRRTISKAPQTPEIVAATARRDALRAQLNEMRELAKPKTTPEQRALKAFKTRTANRIADLQEKMAAGDFSTRKRAPVQLDEEGIRLKASLEKTTKEFEQLKRQTELADRSRWQKVLDRFVRWERAFKLSSPVVFGKLSAAALTRAVTTGAEEVLGAGLGKLPLIREVARQAPREGGLNVPAMAHALTAAFTKGLKDAAQTATRGLADLDIVHGDKLIDKDWVNFFGQLHGMLKAPVKRAEFTLALEKRMAFEMNKGVDVTNPLAQARIASEALNDGYRAIFMQRGFSSDMFNQFVSQLERSKKYQPQGEISARLARFLFPVVRVPANIIAETATGVYGAPMASARTMVAAVKGRLGSLDPVVADSIMRQFKKGSIGLGLMAVGYFTPEMIGGYDWREKRAPGSVKTGGFQVAGVDVPRWMTHAPWFELMQFGATIRHVKDQHLARTGEEKGISEGMWAAGLGLIEETPFVGNMLRVDKLWATKSERDRYVGELIKSTIEPALLQRIAEWTDAAERRRPTSVNEQVKMGIPGLRQDVPEDFRAR